MFIFAFVCLCVREREENGAPPCVKSPLESGQVCGKGLKFAEKRWLVTMVTYSPLSISL